ncbi:MAG: hypothetical protein ABI143_05940 [Caldimonas sp.]
MFSTPIVFKNVALPVQQLKTLPKSLVHELVLRTRSCLSGVCHTCERGLVSGSVRN